MGRGEEDPFQCFASKFFVSKQGIRREIAAPITTLEHFYSSFGRVGLVDSHGGERRREFERTKQLNEICLGETVAKHFDSFVVSGTARYQVVVFCAHV
jgi:hypothetical protein